MKKPKNYWDYDHCLEEAKKYETPSDFCYANQSAYQKARKNKWLKDYTWFISGVKRHTSSRIKWTYDTCLEAAKKYHSRVEFMRNSHSAYNIASKNKWIDDYTWFLTTKEVRHLPRPERTKWTYEVCKELALECSTVGEYNKKHHLACVAARRKGWLKDFSWLKRYGKNEVMNTDNVYAYIFLGTKCVYIGRTVSPKERDTSHHRNDSSVCKFAKKNNLPIPRMQILESGLSIEEGVIREDYWVQYFLGRGFYVINIAQTGEGKGSIGGLGYDKWTKKSCYDKALEYDTLKDFSNENASAYYRAHKMGWDKEYIWLKRNQPRKEWTYEKCHNEAIKYSSKEEFRLKNRSAHQKAYKEGWLYDWFPDRKTTAKAILQYSLEGTFLREYKSITEACGSERKKIGNIIGCCKGRQKTAYKSIWKYKEDA